MSKYNIGLKTLLLQGLSEPEFYGDLVYKFRKIIGTNDFFRPCVHCVVVKEMRMWSFDGIYLNFVTIKAF